MGAYPLGQWLGIIAIVDLAPAIMGPLGGAIADRHSPLRITRSPVLAMLAAGFIVVTQSEP